MASATGGVPSPDLDRAGLGQGGDLGSSRGGGVTQVRLGWPAAHPPRVQPGRGLQRGAGKEPTLSGRMGPNLPTPTRTWDSSLNTQHPSAST